MLFLKSTPALREILDDDEVRPYEGATGGYYHIDGEIYLKMLPNFEIWRLGA